MRARAQAPTSRETTHDRRGLSCRSCAHFDDDPAHLETEVPGILVFGSAYSSARGHAGMCRCLDRFLDPILADDCPSFEALGKDDRSTSSTG